MEGKNQIELYYGTEIPNIAKCRSYEGIIVLQEYHPIVKEGLYQKIFPNAEKFLYFNPVKDPLKNTFLTFKKDRNIIIEQNIKDKLAKAESLMGIEGTDGLFVDDIDHWNLDDINRKKGLEFLSKLSKTCHKNLILNRGFYFWHFLNGIHSILLENLGPNDILNTKDASDILWIKNTLKLNFNLLSLERQFQKPKIFTLSYQKKPSRILKSPDISEALDLIALFVDENLHKNISIDTWDRRFL